MRPLKAFKFFIITVVVLIVAYFVDSSFIAHKKVPVEGEYQVIKSFLFSSPDEISNFEEKLFSRNSTEYKISDYEGNKYLEAVSEDSASAIAYKQRIPKEKDVLISWDWRVEEFPYAKKEESLNDKSVFDFAAQVYVIFYSKFFLNTKAIQYVWTKNIPAGTIDSSPYTKNVKVMVLESGPAETWKKEKRNVKDDYFKLFGEEQEKDIAAIAIMTDSDSTGSSAKAYYSNLIIEGMESLSERGKTKSSGQKRGSEVEVKKREKAEKKELTL